MAESPEGMKETIFQQMLRVGAVREPEIAGYQKELKKKFLWHLQNRLN
jgi:hypothetical protein